MSKASESILASLHNKLAEVMIQSLDRSDEAVFLISRYEDELPNDVKRYLEKQVDINPPLLNSISKFLKDNEIVIDPTDAGELDELDAMLKRKKAEAKGKTNVLSLPIDG